MMWQQPVAVDGRRNEHDLRRPPGAAARGQFENSQPAAAEQVQCAADDAGAEARANQRDRTARGVFVQPLSEVPGDAVGERGRRTHIANGPQVALLAEPRPDTESYALQRRKAACQTAVGAAAKFTSFAARVSIASDEYAVFERRIAACCK